MGPDKADWKAWKVRCNYCPGEVSYNPDARSQFNMKRHLKNRCKGTKQQPVELRQKEAAVLQRGGADGSAMYGPEHLGVLRAFLLMVLKDKMPLGSGTRPGLRQAFQALAPT